MGYKITILKQEKLKIQLQSDTTWKVTTPDGVVYNFSKKERRTEVIDNTYYSGSKHYISSWYLSSVVMPAGQRIDFEYDSPLITTQQKFESASQISQISDCSNYPVPPIESNLTEVTTYTGQTVLNKIVYPNGYIRFGAANRIDLNSSSLSEPQRLSEMKIYSNTSDMLKRYVFKHNYFNSASGSADYLSKRLRLYELNEYGQSSAFKTYLFTYNSINLPDKDSQTIDHWGFYNGPGDGSNKEPHPTYVTACLLKTITYPTGGKINYLFESNDYSNYDSQYMKDDPPFTADHAGRVGIGCRISRVEVFDRDNNLVESRAYSYRRPSQADQSSGKRMSGGIYEYQQMQIVNSQECEGPIHIHRYVTTSNNNLSPGDGASGYPVGYDVVTESYRLGDNGKIEYYFKNEPEVLSNYLCVPNYVSNQNGLLLNKVTYKASGTGYQKIMSEDRKYISANSSIMNALAISPLGIFSGAISTEPIAYRIPSDFIHLSESADTLFNENGISIKRQKYFYDNYSHLQLSRTETIRSDGKKEVTLTTYPLDYSNSGGFLKDMKDHHLVAYPIEQVKYLENGTTKTILSGSITKYKTGGRGLKDQELLLETPAPISSSAFKFSNRATGVLPPAGSPTAFSPDGHYKIRLSYNLYDTKGNLQQYTLSDGTTTSYLWNYNGQYPVAEAKNATLANIAYTSFEGEEKGDWNYTGTISTNASYAYTGKKYYAISAGMSRSGLNSSKKYILSYWQKDGTVTVSGGTVGPAKTGRSYKGWAYIEHNISRATTISLDGSGYVDQVLLYPAEAQLSTFTYDPLIGPSSASDVKQATDYYGYDHFQRLSLIRDLDDKIVKQMKYNYGGVSDTPVPTIFYSNEASGTFQKNNCPAGEIGEEIVYIVSEGKYYSTVSQADANQKAVAEVKANGQAHANAVGDCLYRKAVFSVQSQVSGAYAYYVTFVRISDGQVFEFDQETIESNPNIELENGTYNITVEFQDGSTESDPSEMQSLKLYKNGNVTSCISYTSSGYPGDAQETFQNITITAPDSMVILFSSDTCN